MKTFVQDGKTKLSAKERKALARQRLIETGRICEETKVEAKKGQDKLQDINDRVCAGKDTASIFMDMKTLMTAVAAAKGYIKKGQSKIRKGGSPDDFLNYVTVRMCERWQKQKTDDLLYGAVGKTRIENWCAYANICIFSLLNEYNRSVMDFDVCQMPKYQDKDGDFKDVDFEDRKQELELDSVIFSGKLTPETIKNCIDYLPEDLRRYAVDALFYMTYNKILDKSHESFALIGARILRRRLEDGI